MFVASLTVTVTLLIRMETRMDQQIGKLETKMDHLETRMEQQIGKLETKMEQQNARMDQVVTDIGKLREDVGELKGEMVVAKDRLGLSATA
jgi:chromosome segregation ATPase